MKSLSVFIFAMIILVLAFMPLFKTIESSFDSTNGYYGDNILSKE